MCHSAFLHTPDRPVFRCTDWAIFQAPLEEEIPFNPELHERLAIDTSVENLSGDFLKALAASIPKSRPRDDPTYPIPAGIQDEIPLKNRLRRQWQVSSDPARRAEVNLLVSYLESYLKDFQRWLSECRIARNVSKSTAIIFARAGLRFIQPRPVDVIGKPILWVDTTLHMRVTLDIRLIWSPHIAYFRKKTA